MGIARFIWKWIIIRFSNRRSLIRIVINAPHLHNNSSIIQFVPMLFDLFWCVANFLCIFYVVYSGWSTIYRLFQHFDTMFSKNSPFGHYLFSVYKRNLNWVNSKFKHMYTNHAFICINKPQYIVYTEDEKQYTQSRTKHVLQSKYILLLLFG